MPYKTPKDIARAGVQTRSTKARRSFDKARVAGFLAGAYIAIAGLLAIVVSAGMPEQCSGLPTFITGSVFCLGLILVIVAGSELLTGNMALVPLAAEDVAGKILAIFPIMAFVALGFDHVVANMFCPPAAIVADVPDIGWGDALHSWLFAFVGNAVGASIFVAATYWYLYAREVHEQPGDTPSGAPKRVPAREPAAVGGSGEAVR